MKGPGYPGTLHRIFEHPAMVLRWHVPLTLRLDEADVSVASDERGPLLRTRRMHCLRSARAAPSRATWSHSVYRCRYCSASQAWNISTGHSHRPASVRPAAWSSQAWRTALVSR